MKAECRMQNAERAGTQGGSMLRRSFTASRSGKSTGKRSAGVSPARVSEAAGLRPLFGVWSQAPTRRDARATLCFPEVKYES